MRSTMGMLDEINAAAEQAAEGMSEEQLRAAFIAAQQETAKRKAKQKEYNLNPENKAKRLTYQKDRNERIKADPEQYAKVQATRKAYMSKPEVKEKQKAYRTKRNAEIKAILAEAKRRGIDLSASPAASPA